VGSSPAPQRRRVMEVLHPRCARLDVHRDSVVACIRLADGRRVEQHVEKFGTDHFGLTRRSAIGSNLFAKRPSDGPQSLASAMPPLPSSSPRSALT
jgi:hypothetical protein